MEVITKKEWKGLFESGFTERAQFQLLTLFVWIGVFILVVQSRKYWNLGGLDNCRLWLPMIHILPWYVGLSERKRVSSLAHNEVYSSDSLSLLSQVMLRILWVSYVVLVLIEYSLY
jgi:uncharacterized membrane protein